MCADKDLCGLIFHSFIFQVYKLAVVGICIIHWKVSLIVQTLFRIQICLTLKWPYKILILRVIELCLQIIVTWYTEEGGSCSLFIFWIWISTEKIGYENKKFKFRKHGNNLKFKLRSYLKIEGDIREIKYECICLF